MQKLGIWLNLSKTQANLKLDLSWYSLNKKLKVFSCDNCQSNSNFSSFNSIARFLNF